MNSFHLELIFFLALSFSLGLTPLFALQAKRLKIVDKPAHRKTHEESIPYLGGPAIFASLLLALLITLFFNPDIPHYLQSAGLIKISFIMVGTLGIGIVGLLDDLRDLRPRYKFAGQLIFVTLFAVLGFHFDILHLPGLPPISLSYLAIPFTIFWMLAIINAFNMVDGLDGLAVTVATSSLILLGAGSSLVGSSNMLLLAVGALGALLGFIPYNWKPARIYLGDAGSGGIGMFLASSLVALGQTPTFPLNLAVEKVPTQPFLYQILIATLMVAYPVLEILLTVSRRILHGRPVTRGDQGHIHHRLLKLGLDKPYICLAAWILNHLPGLAAIAILAKYHGWATWSLSLFGVILGWGLSALGFLDFLKPMVVARLRPHYQIAHHFITMQKLKLGLAPTREDVLSLVNQTCAELGVKSYRFMIIPGDNGQGGLDYTNDWDPLRAKGNVNRDQVSLKDNHGAAEWVFTHPTIGEEELDMEYRVLISEFMREALQTALALGENSTTLELPSVVALPTKFVSSNALRRRHKFNSQSAPSHVNFN